MTSKWKQTKWTCGRLDAGELCRRGPDKQGHCQADFACKPNRKGDRWHCARSLEQGGPCEQGPHPEGQCGLPVRPCQPQRTDNNFHTLFLRGSLLISLAVLLLILGHSYWPHRLSPGKLSAAHSAITNCSECHAAADHPPHRILTILLHKALNNNNQRCLACHDLGKHPKQPHGVAPAILKAKTIQLQSQKTGSKSSLPLFHHRFAFLLDKHEAMACGTCHREHRGRAFSPAQVDNQTCHTCHVTPFDTFSKNHPEFKEYPYHHPTAIKFDHVSHLSKHFHDPKYAAEAPKQCQSCHRLDRQGRLMRVLSYSKTCASCHDQEIRGKNRADEKGLQFFTIPGLDLATLKAHQIAIGQWPSDAEGELTLFTQILLNKNLRFKKAFVKIRDLDWMDLEDATPAQLTAVAEVAWAIKFFLCDLAMQGTDVIYQRLAKTATPELMPKASIKALIQQSFPDLAKEVGDKRAHKPAPEIQPFKAPKTDPSPAERQGADWVTQGGWYQEGFGLYYFPRHHADQFIKIWLDESTHTALFKQLADPKAPGACGKCHRVLKTESGKLAMAWGAKTPKQYQHDFTAFAHGSHLNLPGKKACKTCHQLNSQADYMTNYQTPAPKVMVTQFNHIKKSTCLTCHKTSKTSENCLTCHKYHIGSIKAKQTPTNIHEMLPPPPGDPAHN